MPWLMMHFDLLIRLVPHTSDWVCLFMGLLSADSVMSSIYAEPLGVGSCSVSVDSGLGKLRDDGLSLAHLFAMPSTKLMLCDHSLFLLELTTTYMESHSKPTR